VILAGILLKLGGYGFMRFPLPMFPQASELFTPLVFALSVIAIVYTSLVAFRQTDIKKLIAYSSVAHMGFVTMGIFSGNGRASRAPLPDAQPRADLRRALPLRRRGLRPHAHPRDRLLRRAGEPHAVVRGRCSCCSPLGNVGLPGTSGFIGEILTMTGPTGSHGRRSRRHGVILSAV
jgi:NADH-quinone oxidoreductase subunit M